MVGKAISDGVQDAQKDVEKIDKESAEHKAEIEAQA
jgi:hypothetical protein